MASIDAQAPPRAVLYLRLSALADDSSSIVRQEADLRALCEREGWEVVAVLADEGISGRKERDKATEAVRMIADGEADVLAVWKLDRFTRQGFDGLGAISKALAKREERAAKGGRPALFIALQDGLRSDGAAFRLVAGVLSEVARSEAENTAARQRSAIAYRKLAAHRFTGGVVPLGYRSVPAPEGEAPGRVLVPSPYEARIVREVAEKLLSGEESISSMARELTRRGVWTARSPARRAYLRGDDPAGLDPGLWRPSSVRTGWVSESLAGRVIHHEQYVVDPETGLPAEVWPAILPMETIDKLRTAFRWTPPKEARKRLGWHDTGEPSRRPARHAARMLSGLVFCHECGSRMYITTSNGKPIYACPSKRNGGPCTRTVSIAAEPLEDWISEQYLAVVGAAPELAPPPVGGSSKDTALVELNRLIAAAMARLDDAETPAEEEEALARWRRLKAERAELEAAPMPTAEPTFTGRTLREAWESSTNVSWRRDLLMSAMDSIEVAPSEPGSPRRDPVNTDRVTVRWRS